MSRPACPARENYEDLLERLKTYFPVPISDPIMDSYFVHTISRFLNQIDELKSAVPILGHGQPRESGRDPTAATFPEQMRSVEELTGLLADFLKNMPIWAHPNSQVNVVPPTTIPSIMAFIAATIYNPNIIWDEYSAGFAEAEIQAVTMLADLVGYDPRQAGGLFTFGGTGTILYGCKLGLEKCFGGRVMEEGIREDAKIVASAASHYARLNVSGWLGLGMKNLVTIPTIRDNEMDLDALEDYLRCAFTAGEKIAVIIATMGTTDAFGIDDIGAIVQVRDRLAQEFGLAQPPHIHADAVIGWIWAVFRDYDFAANHLGFHARTLRSLQDSLERLGAMGLADSLGVDFHKTGYAPYISSAFLVRNREDLTLLSREPEEMPYLYQFGRYHPGIYTLECSRPGSGALAALANMHLLGKQGYRVLIGHVVEMAEMLRERLEASPVVEVLNDYNYGPVTLFRIYPDGVDADVVFQQELSDPHYRDSLLAHNRYNREIFHRVRQKALEGAGVLLSWTDAYRHADYEGEAGPPVAALKSYILSPWTDQAAITQVVDQIMAARQALPEFPL